MTTKLILSAILIVIGVTIVVMLFPNNFGDEKKILIDTQDSSDEIITDIYTVKDDHVNGDGAILISKKNCGDSETCYDLTVECSSIPLRTVRVKAHHNSSSLGSIILTTGGSGRGFYSTSYGSNGRNVVEKLHDVGYEVYEISWTNNSGWTTGTEGYGYTKAMCGYAEVVKWIHENVADNPEVMCSSGNSGGSMQIAYGLTTYNLDQYLDLAVLSGGPGTSDLVEAIFGIPNGDAMWSDDVAAFALTDKIEGWLYNNYIKRRKSITPSNTILDTLNSDSIVTDVLGRNYKYSLQVHFVESNESGDGDKDSIGHSQARIYFDRIESEKEWHYLGDSVTEHGVPSTKEGSEKIIEIMKEECVI